MSDNATLVERLNERKAYFRDGGPDHWPMAELLRSAAARIAELEAELEVSKGLDRSRNIEAQEITGEFVRLQAARIAELEAELATIDEAAVRNGVALQYESREAERERMIKLGLSFILDQQAREDFIQLARSTP